MTEARATTDVHQEKVFEAHIVSCLTIDQGYIERDCTAHYSVARALDTDLLSHFLKTTQPEARQMPEDHYSAQAEAEVLKRLKKSLKQIPAHVALREGINLVPNIRFALCYFKPASNLNPNMTRLYDVNLLSVMRQVTYSAKKMNAIDLATFVYGTAKCSLNANQHEKGA